MAWLPARSTPARVAAQGCFSSSYSASPKVSGSRMAAPGKLTGSKTRERLALSLALERELGGPPPAGAAPGRAKPKGAAATAGAGAATGTGTGTGTALGAAAAAAGATATTAAAPAGSSIVTAANDDYEASKVTKKSNRAEKDEERAAVAELDRWSVFQMPAGGAGDGEDDDSF